MAEDFDRQEEFEAKETSHHLPLGWTILTVGLIVWGIYYLITYSPAFSGWTQVKEYEESVKMDPIRKAPAAKGPADVGPVKNPLSGDPNAIAEGKKIYAEQCAACHGGAGEGGIGPSVKDKVFLSKQGDASDGVYYSVVEKGTEAGAVIDGRSAKGGMPPFGGTLDRNKIWSLVSYMRSLQDK